MRISVCASRTIYQFLHVILRSSSCTTITSTLNRLEESFSVCQCHVSNIRQGQLFVCIQLASGTRCSSTPSFGMSDANYFFIVPGANFLPRVQCVPFKNTETYPPLLPEAVWPVCFLFLSLWHPNSPATPQLLPAADIKFFWKPGWGMWRGEAEAWTLTVSCSQLGKEEMGWSHHGKQHWTTTHTLPMRLNTPLKCMGVYLKFECRQTMSMWLLKKLSCPQLHFSESAWECMCIWMNTGHSVMCFVIMKRVGRCLCSSPLFLSLSAHSQTDGAWKTVLAVLKGSKEE